jgi:hypothetical protein
MDALKASLYAQLDDEKKLQDAISREKQMREESDQTRIAGKDSWEKERQCMRSEIEKAGKDIDTLRRQCEELREQRGADADRAKSDMCREMDRLKAEAQAERLAFERERCDLENVVQTLEGRIAAFKVQIGALEGSIKALDVEETREKEAHLREKGELLRALEECEHALDAEKQRHEKTRELCALSEVARIATEVDLTMVKNEVQGVYDANLKLQREAAVACVERDEMRGLVREREEWVRELEGERDRDREEGNSAMAVAAKQMQVFVGVCI